MLLLLQPAAVVEQAREAAMRTLTRAGARFLRATRTSEDYRLFALPGGPPARPGMVRTPDGARIAVEVWAIPATRLGGFLKGVPSPLSIGTATLEDGTQVKAFLCEAAGLEGAEDVTAFGGWRGYLDAGAGPR